MALFLFTKALLSGEPIQVFNHGHMFEISLTSTTSSKACACWISHSQTRFDTANLVGHQLGTTSVFNIGNSSPTPLIDYIEALEQALGVKAQMQMKPIQPGDASHVG